MRFLISFWIQNFDMNQCLLNTTLTKGDKGSDLPINCIWWLQVSCTKPVGLDPQYNGEETDGLGGSVQNLSS